VGQWSNNLKEKRAGHFWQVDLLSGLRGISFDMLHAAGMQPEEIEDFVPKVKSELERGDVRMYTPWYICHILFCLCRVLDAILAGSFTAKSRCWMRRSSRRNTSPRRW